MNLVLSREQKYIELADQVKFQAWRVEDLYSFGNTFIVNIDTPFVPIEQLYNLYVQDVIGTSNEYTSYRLVSEVIYDGALKDWLVLPLDQLNVPIQKNKLSIPYTVTFNPYNLIEGHHSARLSFKILGLKNNKEHEVSTFSYSYNFKVFPENHFYSPLVIDIVNSTAKKDHKTFEVMGDFEVIVPPGMLLWYRGNSYSSYKGYGFHQFGLEIDNTIPIDSFKTLTVKYPSTTYNVLVNTSVFTDYSPKRMLFNASGGIIEKPIQYIYFADEGDYTLKYPYWLQVRALNTTPRSLEVILPSADNFGTGEFNQAITLQFSNRKIEIPVILNIYDGFNLGLKSGEILFAESTEVLQFTSSSNSNHLNIELILDDGEVNLFNFNYKVPFYQKKAEFSLSEILRRQVILKNYFTPDFSRLELPILSLIIKELQGDLVLKEYMKTNIPVMNGEKPVRMYDGIAILNTDVLERFTPKGLGVVNVLSPGLFDYSIRINSVIVNRIEKVTGVIRSLCLDFKKLEVKEGDMVELVLHTPKGDLSKAFIITPYTHHSTVIYYKNKHGLMSTIEFTGEVKIDVEKKRKLEKYTANGDYKTRAYIEDSQEKLTINTGYVLTDQIELINDLLDSTEAFFYQDSNRFMLIPTSEKITKRNTTEFLNSFQIEFIINDTDYAQVHF